MRLEVSEDTLFVALETAEGPMEGPWRLDRPCGDLAEVSLLFAINDETGLVVPWHDIVLLEIALPRGEKP